MLARDVMRSHPSVVLSDDPTAKAARILRDRKIGFLPVIDNLRDRSLLGVLTDRDIVVRCVAQDHDSAACLVRDHMTAGSLVFVNPETDVEEVRTRMLGLRLRRLPVLDANGGVVGVVSLADLRKQLSGDASQRAEPVTYRGVRASAAVS